jgi:hypothetical protein
MINLKAEYGARFRITLDESAKCGDVTREERLWLFQIPCKYGHIYVHGENRLGAWTGNRLMRGKLMALPGVKAFQVGDAECTVTFDPACLEQVAQLLQARKRRVLSEAERERLVAMSGTALARSLEARGILNPREGDSTALEADVEDDLMPGTSEGV